LLAAGWIGIFSQPAAAEPPTEASRHFAEGRALVKKGDLDGAKKAYAAAVKADPGKAEYRGQYSMVRRAIKIREKMVLEKDPIKWSGLAQSLRSFYLTEGLYPEALALSRQLHEKLKIGETAILLARVQMKMGQNAEAVKVLKGLDSNEVTPQTQVLLGLGLAREGKTAEAKRIAGAIAVPRDADDTLLFPLAGLYARVGDSGRAISTLRRSFEMTPPRELNVYKEIARTSKDFASISKSPDFAKVMRIESIVKESKCSEGTECGQCPMRKRSQCPSGKE
jgi:tetratricopeptide (TPR) repeat protein